MTRGHFGISTSEWIRGEIIKRNRVRPYDLWLQYKNQIGEGKHVGSTQTWSTMWYLLRKLGLVRLAYTEKSSSNKIYHYHEIVPGMENDEAWQSPYHYAYPHLYSDDLKVQAYWQRRNKGETEKKKKTKRRQQ